MHRASSIFEQFALTIRWYSRIDSYYEVRCFRSFVFVFLRYIRTFLPVPEDPDLRIYNPYPIRSYVTRRAHNSTVREPRRLGGRWGGFTSADGYLRCVVVDTEPKVPPPHHTHTPTPCNPLSYGKWFKTYRTEVLSTRNRCHPPFACLHVAL